MSKGLVWVILISIIIGVATFVLTSQKTIQTISEVKSKSFAKNPAPKTTNPPITESSDLAKEIDQLIPPDYEKEFQALREEIKNF